MEHESMSPINYVPTFARGLKLLLVHDDIFSLTYLSSLLEQYSFNVTATDEASAALSMICNDENRFKLAVAKVNMPGIDALSFLDALHEKEIPVIFISSGGFDAVTWKALSKGLCYFLEEPIHLEDLKYVWQHVYHSKTNSAKEAQNADCETINKENKRVILVEENQLKEIQNACIEQLMSSQCRAHGANGKGNRDDNEGKQRGNETELSSSLDDFDSIDHSAMEREERREHKSGSAKKKRIVWTAELHHKFTKAISVLGEQKLRPKEIQHEMNVPGLTTRQVASHLQKYKSQIKRFQIACNSDLPPAQTSSNLGGRNIFPAPFESKGYLGLPSPSASLNVSQNENQFLMNHAQTQESGVCKLLKTPANPSFTNEFPTGLANYGSQSPDATVGQPVPDASMDQNQPATEHDDIGEMLEEYCGSSNCFDNGINQGNADQYSDILRTLLGDSSSLPDFDICNLSIS